MPLEDAKEYCVDTAGNWDDTNQCLLDHISDLNTDCAAWISMSGGSCTYQAQLSFSLFSLVFGGKSPGKYDLML